MQEGIVVYEGGFGPFNYHVKDVEDWLLEVNNNKKTTRALPAGTRGAR